MIGFILRVLVFFGLGLFSGFGYFRGVRESARIYQDTGERARPVAMHVFRLLLVVALFALIWKAGPPAWLSALAGFFASRLFVGKPSSREP